MSNPTTPMHDLQTHVGQERRTSNLPRFLENNVGSAGGEKVHLPLDQCHVLYFPINQKNRNVHEPTLTETQKILRFLKPPK